MDVQEVRQGWLKVKEKLEEDAVPEHILNTWIAPIEAAEFSNNTLVLLAPHQFAVDILKRSWSHKIKSAVKSVFGEDATFSLNYDADFAENYIKNQKKLSSKISAGQSEEDIKKEEIRQSLAQMQSDANLNLNLKFENFVVGENSKFAYNAAFSVANNPSKKFNPLFIYGASGLGKTHLLQAIGHHIIFNTKLKVKYIRMEDYFLQWMKCFETTETGGKRKNYGDSSKMRKFHQKFQNVDVLLMDDIQFIESKQKTMEDFFSTFEALYTNNKQIVIASDRQPADIPKLDDRLRTRFEMGLVVDIVPPDYDTRFEIVKAYAKEIETNAEDDVFSFIAENFVNNVRELKGAFNKVSAYCEFLNIDINLENAQKALKLEVKKKNITISMLAQKVAKHFSVTLEDLKSTARAQKIALARHVAVYLSRDFLQLSYESIGNFFNKKHTTIMYSYDTIKNRLKTDDELQTTVDVIRASLKG